MSSGGIELMWLLGLGLDVPSLTGACCLLPGPVLQWDGRMQGSCPPVGWPYTRLLVRGGCARVSGSRAL